MASKPPGSCCTIGTLHEGTPKGTFQTTAGYESYIARPAPGKEHKKVGILFLTDVMGHRAANAQLLADAFAENGYLTVMPDIMFGDPIPIERPADFDIGKWMQGIAPHGNKPHTPEHVYPVVEAMAKWMKTEGGCDRVAGLGYCYGAKYVAHLLKDQIEVGYFAHPSYVDKEQLAAIKGPLTIAAAETDQIFTVELRQESEEILRNIEPKIPWQIVLYSGASHGFSVRGDLSVPAIKFAKEQAFVQGITWLDQWLLK